MSLCAHPLAVLTESLSHALVHVNSICIFHELPNHLALFVFHHQNLLWFSHPTDHHQTNLEEEEEEKEEL